MAIERREFVKLSVASGLAATLTTSGNRALAADGDGLPIIDTHQHLWDLVQFQPPWLSGADAKIAAKHDMSNYLAETAGLNVVKAVYMEVDVAPEDQDKEADYILSIIAAKKSPTVAAVISGRPASDKFARYMKRHRDNPLIKGVRQVLHAGSAERGLCLQPQFVKSVQLLGEMEKTFDLCMRPTELADGAALAQKCPDTRFIVDHCGNADPGAWQVKEKQAAAPGHTVEQWKTDMGKLAKLPNVICKISGIVARAPKGWTPDHLAPAINFCLDEFGPDRVVFGGDWPVCKLGASYAEWVDALKQIISPRPVADQKKLLHDNAVKHYRLV
jgi:predicted TIM-barrel fold metal-dependent hydrolase